MARQNILNCLPTLPTALCSLALLTSVPHLCLFHLSNRITELTWLQLYLFTTHSRNLFFFCPQMIYVDQSHALVFFFSYYLYITVNFRMSPS